MILVELIVGLGNIFAFSTLKKIDGNPTWKPVEENFWKNKRMSKVLEFIAFLQKCGFQNLPKSWQNRMNWKGEQF